MLRVGRSVVVGYSGGCCCPGDHASLQARASVRRGGAVTRIGTVSLSRAFIVRSTSEIRMIIDRYCELPEL